MKRSKCHFLSHKSTPLFLEKLLWRKNQSSFYESHNKHKQTARKIRIPLCWYRWCTHYQLCFKVSNYFCSLTCLENTISLYSNNSVAWHFLERCLVDDVEAGDTDNGHEQTIDFVKLRWKRDSFAANHQIPCPLKNAKFIVVCHPGLKLYRTMNARNLVHALTTHSTNLYVSCQSHFYSVSPM
jgi:hypothetical protein